MTTKLLLAVIVSFSSIAGIVQAQEQPKPAAPAGPVVDAEKLKAFDALCQKVQKDAGAATPQEVEQMLALARDVGKPLTAHLAIKSYLARNPEPQPSLMLLAADNAALAADYRTAVARYKAYLRNAKPSKETSDVAAKIYQISFDFLGATDDAYDFLNRFGDQLIRLKPGKEKLTVEEAGADGEPQE